MNEHQSVKLRREMRKLWNRYMSAMHTLHFLKRLKLAVLILCAPERATKYMLTLGEKRYAKEE